MNYLTKFDSDGKRIASYLLDGTVTPEEYARLLDEGYIEISEEDWNYYVGNKGGGDNGTGYIYDSATGKPVSAPPYEPSKEEQLLTEIRAISHSGARVTAEDIRRVVEAAHGNNFGG